MVEPPHTDHDAPGPDYDDAPPPLASVTNLRPATHNLQAEAALLGAILVRPDTLDHTLEIRPEHFYKPAHGHVYAAVQHLAAHDTPIDAVTVADQLRTVGLLDHVGGGGFLVELAANVPSTTTAPAYARIILEHAATRRLIADLTAALDDAASGHTARARDRLEQITDTPGVASTWSPVDLTTILDGTFEPLVPVHGARDDGHALLYPGKVHAFNAESESGKTWLALWVVLQELEHGEHVAYIDFEDDARGVIGRLLAMGAQTTQIAACFHYIRPDDQLTPQATAELLRTINGHGCVLAIIDGVTEAMVGNGLSIKENDDAAKFLAMLPRPIARTGCAVAMIDHVVKDKTQRDAHAIGAQHKRAGIDGASYSLEVVTPFGQGLVGTAKLTVTKDRHGYIRGHAAGGRNAGTLRIASTGTDHVDVSVLAANQDAPGESFRPTGVMEQVSEVIRKLTESGIQANVRKVREMTNARPTTVTAALTALETEGYVTLEAGPRGAKLYAHATPYRQINDPTSDQYEPPRDDPPEDDPDDLPEPF